MGAKLPTTQNLIYHCKQLLLIVWVILTTFIWLLLYGTNPLILKVSPLTYKMMIQTRNVILPYVYRQYIYVERNINKDPEAQ